MKKYRPLLVALAALIAGHLSYVFASPYVFMQIAMKRISENFTKINQFNSGPRTTTASRQIVRPSPDLAYSACVYDLNGGPIHVYGAPWSDYMSISVFADNSDNFYSQNDREAKGGVNFILAKTGQKVPSGLKTVYSPSNKGIILDRRLAPTQEKFDLAKAARAANKCEKFAAYKHLNQ